MRKVRAAIVGNSMLILIAALLLMLMSNTASADKVDDFVKAEMAKQHIPGLLLAVVQSGRIVKAQGYGLADIELKTPATPDTGYQLASMTKPFVALGIMRLVERDKVSLDDPVSKYLDGLPIAWSGITVRHLLTHTSGLVDCENKPTINEKKDYTEEQILRSLFDQPLEFESGANYLYSNSNYLILGMIIHKVSAKTWGKFLRDEMLDPLGMDATHVNGIQGSSHLAVGYSLRTGEPKRGDPISPTVLATAYGGLNSTVLDLAKWDIALDAGKIVKRSTLEQMWAPTRLTGGANSAYGLGWPTGRYNDHLCVHNGGARSTGFSTILDKYPDDKLTVIVLTNGFPVNTKHIAQGVAGCYVPALGPHAYAPIEDKEPTVTALIQNVLNRMIEGKADPDSFAPEIRAALFPDVIRQIGGHLKSLGPCRPLVLVERKDKGERGSYRYQAVFEKATLYPVLTLDKDGKVSGLEIQPE